MLALHAATNGEVTALQQRATGAPALLLTSTLFIHLLGLNYLLSDHLGSSWWWMRAILAASLVAGWLAGNFFQASLGISALLLAWMASSIIIHVVMI